MEKRHEVLFRQLEDYRRELLRVVDGLTEEEADIVPKGFNNNIRWNLGHVYLDQYLWIQHVTKEPIPIPEGFRDWFVWLRHQPCHVAHKAPVAVCIKRIIGGAANENLRMVRGAPRRRIRADRIRHAHDRPSVSAHHFP
ncbi:DinB family protein [Geobacillus sp. C56-T2]|nr:DinB family protein [Geobacillus sp. C56-T2]